MSHTNSKAIVEEPTSKRNTRARTISVPVMWYRPFHSTQVTYSWVGKRNRFSAGCGGVCVWFGCCEARDNDSVSTALPLTLMPDGVDDDDDADDDPGLEFDALESHREGAVARKNLSLSS